MYVIGAWSFAIAICYWFQMIETQFRWCSLPSGIHTNCTTPVAGTRARQPRAPWAKPPRSEGFTIVIISLAPIICSFYGIPRGSDNAEIRSYVHIRLVILTAVSNFHCTYIWETLGKQASAERVSLRIRPQVRIQQVYTKCREVKVFWGNCEGENVSQTFVIISTWFHANNGVQG